jgi:hypothetical protein
MDVRIGQGRSRASCRIVTAQDVIDERLKQRRVWVADRSDIHEKADYMGATVAGQTS